jgi:hypothetical protein
LRVDSRRGRVCVIPETVIPRLPALAVLLALAGCSGCDERADASPALDAAPPPAPPPSATAAPSGTASAEKGEFKILKLVFTSDVKNKEPVDKLDAAQPGARVWAHLTMRNRTAEPRQIALIFKVNGDQRTKIDLKVEPSWSYRTYGYSTLRASDTTGEVVVEIRDEGGAVVSTAKLPIKGDGPAKPQRQAKPVPPDED